MDSPRLPRFARVANAKPIQITERDRAIIQTVHRHRFLRSSHIVALIGGNAQPILRRLQKLYHHGYLERPRAQLEYYHKAGSRHIVYGLGNKGASLLRKELGLRIQPLRWGEKNRSVGRIFLEHALLVSDVMVAVELACRTSGLVQFISQDEITLPADIRALAQPFRWRVEVGPRQKLGVVPDQVFALEYADPTGRTERAYYFVEADRGTMPVKRSGLSQTSFYRKLLAYEATWSTGLHRSRFGFHRFRVLTVTKSAERATSLVQCAAGLKTGHGLFLFADKSILEKPDQILGSGWRAVRQGDGASLVG